MPPLVSADIRGYTSIGYPRISADIHGNVHAHLAGSILPHLRRQACRLQVQASCQTRSCAWQYTSGMKVHCPALEPGSAQPGTRHGPSRTMCSSRDRLTETRSHKRRAELSVRSTVSIFHYSCSLFRLSLGRGYSNTYDQRTSKPQIWLQISPK